MKLVLLGIACILFGFSMSLLQLTMFADELFFEITSAVAPFLGITFAFIGAFEKDKKD